ncbi:MAG: phage DNA encapsidation protein [Eubacterium sp.]|nr:phage DNA encapsidation protein [Eubacterium sp.]
MSQYYDGTKLLSMMDINGNKPEIFMCTSNRTAGKTTYFNRLAVNRFIKNKSKFALLYRFNYELADVASKFFKDIQGLFFPTYTLDAKPRSKGIYSDLYLNDEHCGYAITINSADNIKKLSHLFSDVDMMIFDEFQSETNKYCSNEIQKFLSIHTSIARGQGKQIRYTPVYMISNPVSIINPYYVEMGISARLRDDTRFLKGDGFVLEQGFNEVASEAMLDSGFNRAFSSNKYMAYAAQSVYLNDNKAFIETPQGYNRYLVTLRYMGKDYGIREYPNLGIVYANDKPDYTYSTKITVTTEDHQINYVMLRRNDLVLANLRYLFEHGCFRFKDLQCKEVVLTVLSY